MERGERWDAGALVELDETCLRGLIRRFREGAGGDRPERKHDSQKSRARTSLVAHSTRFGETVQRRAG